MPGLKAVVDDGILANWGLFPQWIITVVRLGWGPLLVVGLATRAAALVGGQLLLLQFVYSSSGRWMWEQPHERVPMRILALVPAGPVCGLGRRLTRRGVRRWRGWPF